MTTDATRNAGTLLPLEGGVARLDETAALPATIAAEAIVVVSGTSADKTDAPFTVSLAAVPPMTNPKHGGCSVTPGAAAPGAAASGLFALAALVAGARRRRVREDGRSETAARA